jgi:hypothetical protein
MLSKNVADISKHIEKLAARQVLTTHKGVHTECTKFTAPVRAKA